MAEMGDGRYVMKERLKSELTRLWTGELAAVVMFWVCFFTFRVWITSVKMLCSIVFPLIVLSIILIQGSVFWWILAKRLSVPQFAVRYTGKVYRILKIIDVILLCMALISIIVNYSTFNVMIISGFLWAFAVIEWINYFERRLSYSYNPVVLLRRMKNRNLKKSKIAKEIENGFIFRKNY